MMPFVIVAVIAAIAVVVVVLALAFGSGTRRQERPSGGPPGPSGQTPT